jgi:hypothetical protein
MKLLLVCVLLIGCGGNTDALFLNNEVVNEAGVLPDVVADTGIDVGAVQDSPPDGETDHPGPDVALEAASPDAQAVDVPDAPPDVDPCPCYRNLAMDVHCTTEHPEAWVCQSACGRPGCVYEYVPQPGLACCQKPDGN